MFPNLTITNLRQGLCALFGFIHFLNIGFLTSLSHILVRELKNQEIPISKDDFTWIASINLLPMGPVAIICGILMQKVPKRYILIFSIILEIIGWAQNFFFARYSVMAILIGRFIIGIALGLIGPNIALYMAEVSHPKMRGVYSSALYAGLPIGIMICNVAASILSSKTGILICMFLAVINLIIVLYLEENYVWFLKKNDVSKVREAFYWYRSENEDSEKELSSYISSHLTSNLSETQKTYFGTDFKENCKLISLPLFASTILMMTMHFSGSKVIAFYSINMMETAVPSLSVYISTVILDLIRVFATILACILVKKFPIRLLYIVSGSISALSHFAFCLFQYYSDYAQVFPILSLLSIVAYILFSSCGIICLPWVICAEIFPLKVKNVGNGICIFFYYCAFFLTIKYAYLLEVYLGLIGEFVFFGSWTVLATIIMYFYLPETKSRTLGEIEDEYVSKCNNMK